MKYKVNVHKTSEGYAVWVLVLVCFLSLGYWLFAAASDSVYRVQCSVLYLLLVKILRD